jgi:uncharacterized membrane protein YdfJ with MMPL/SSD domain
VPQQTPAEPERTPPVVSPVMSEAERDAFLSRLEDALTARIAERVDARLGQVRSAGRWTRRRVAVATTAIVATALILALPVVTTSSGPAPDRQEIGSARSPREVVIGRPKPPMPPEPPSKPAPPERP